MRQMLQTLVRRIEYDFTTFAGRLYMDDYCCCDMPDCIAFFKKIDPNVVYISTMAGDEQDTEYRLIDGEWQAFLPWEEHAPAGHANAVTTGVTSRRGSMVT